MENKSRAENIRRISIGKLSVEHKINKRGGKENAVDRQKTQHTRESTSQHLINFGMNILCGIIL